MQIYWKMVFQISIWSFSKHSYCLMHKKIPLTAMHYGMDMIPSFGMNMDITVSSIEETTLCPTWRLQVMSHAVDCILQTSIHTTCVLLRFYILHTCLMVTRLVPRATSRLILKLDREYVVHSWIKQGVEHHIMKIMSIFSHWYSSF